MAADCPMFFFSILCKLNIFWLLDWSFEGITIAWIEIWAEIISQLIRLIFIYFGNHLDTFSSKNAELSLIQAPFNMNFCLFISVLFHSKLNIWGFSLLVGPNNQFEDVTLGFQNISHYCLTIYRLNNRPICLFSILPQCKLNIFGFWAHHLIIFLGLFRHFTD